MSERWNDPGENLPLDVLPCSNGEFAPLPPTAKQEAVMALAERETERWRRRFGMSRRQFVRTSAAMAIGFWALDAIGAGRLGRFASAHNTETTDACDLEWAGKEGLETISNLPGEFIFDVQSHHIDPDGAWRVNNPGFHAVFATLWPQSSWALGDQPEVRPDGSIRGGGAGELDPIQNLSRFHYLKELFLDSATSMTVLSAVPTGEDTKQPLPIAEAASTVHTVNGLAGSQRSVMHAFVMPNRGYGGRHTPKRKPLYRDEEFALMWERAERYKGFLRGWKVYPAWGDIPYASGWHLDTQEVGLPFIEEVRKISQAIPEIPPVIAAHKGFALPAFDQTAAAPRDVGTAARQNPDINFVIYHSGHDTGEAQGPYPGDDKVRSGERKVDALIKSLRENRWDASLFIEPGKVFGNVPNVFAELGSVWRDVMATAEADQAAHLLGKLITHVGPKRVIWGTDSLWYGSPQAEIVALRRFEFTDEGKALYNLPYGLEGDRDDPTQPAPSPDRTIRNGIFGYNAAEVYRVDPYAQRNAITCDHVNGMRASYLTDPLTERESAPQAGNRMLGARTRRELFHSLSMKPWGP